MLGGHWTAGDTYKLFVFRFGVFNFVGFFRTVSVGWVVFAVERRIFFSDGGHDSIRVVIFSSTIRYSNERKNFNYLKEILKNFTSIKRSRDIVRPFWSILTA